MNKCLTLRRVAASLVVLLGSSSAAFAHLSRTHAVSQAWVAQITAVFSNVGAVPMAKMGREARSLSIPLLSQLDEKRKVVDFASRPFILAPLIKALETLHARKYPTPLIELTPESFASLDSDALRSEALIDAAIIAESIAADEADKVLAAYREGVTRKNVQKLLTAVQFASRNSLYLDQQRITDLSAASSGLTQFKERRNAALKDFAHELAGKYVNGKITPETLFSWHDGALYVADVSLESQDAPFADIIASRISALKSVQRGPWVADEARLHIAALTQPQVRMKLGEGRISTFNDQLTDILHSSLTLNPGERRLARAHARLRALRWRDMILAISDFATILDAHVRHFVVAGPNSIKARAELIILNGHEDDIPMLSWKQLQVARNTILDRLKYGQIFSGLFFVAGAAYAFFDLAKNGYTPLSPFIVFGVSVPVLFLLIFHWLTNRFQTDEQFKQVESHIQTLQKKLPERPQPPVAEASPVSSVHTAGSSVPA